MRIALISLISICLAFSFSCKKTKPAEANILVKDTLDRPIRGATVVLRQDSVVSTTTGARADVYQEKTTSSDGNAHFEFEWEAVLNVEVTKDALSAKDYIRLEQSKTVSKTIIAK